MRAHETRQSQFRRTGCICHRPRDLVEETMWKVGAGNRGHERSLDHLTRSLRAKDIYTEKVPQRLL